MTTPAAKMTSPGAAAAAASLDASRSKLIERRRCTVGRFRSVVKVVDGVQAEAVRTGEATGETPTGSYFDWLADEQLGSIIALLLNGAAPPAHWHGAWYREHLASTRNSVVAFACSNRRFTRVLRTMCKREHAECLARGTVVAMPRDPDEPFACTEQARLELHSAEQRQMLKQAHSALACHCAGKCCANLQKAFNRDLRKGDVIPLPTSPRLGPRQEVPHKLVPVLENCEELAVSEDGAHAFAAIMMKRSITRERHVRIAKIVQNAVEKELFGDSSTAFEEVASAEFAVEPLLDGTPEANADVALWSPERMYAAPDGSGVACIVPLSYDTAAGDVEGAHSALLYWDGVAGRMVRISKPETASILPADAMIRSPQCAWFAPSPSGMRLIVAWSTEYVDAYGSLYASDSMSYEVVSAFQFTTHSLDGPGGAPELVEATGAMPLGRLQQCQPFAGGEQVLAVLEKTSLGYSAYVCDVAGDAYSLVPQAHWGKDGFYGVSVSPMGDCMATVSEARGGGRQHLVLELLDRVHYATFKHSNKIDLTPYLTSTRHNKRFGDDALGYAVGFSPCGRFVTVVDRHPEFGEGPKNYGVVIVDTAMRRRGHGNLRARALFDTETQAPRGFFWTHRGIWMMPPGTDHRGRIGPAGGALCLFAPCPLSLT